MKSMTNLLLLTFAASLAVAGCSAEKAIETSSEEAASTVCTPLEETCDYGCFFQGGPSTDDCMIKCNATGTAWKTLIDCGYAQVFPYSSSCFDTEPHPICVYN